MASAHPRVLAALGRALSLELTAVQQYLTHSSLLESWGDQAASDRFRRETVEEMQHSERLVKRMIALGVAPAASQLRPVATAPDLLSLLELNRILEDQLVAHYAEATRFCRLIGDTLHAEFFQALLEEEQHHGVEIANWLAELRPTPVMARASF